MSEIRYSFLTQATEKTSNLAVNDKFKLIMAIQTCIVERSLRHVFGDIIRTLRPVVFILISQLQMSA